MKKVRITVMRTARYDDLIERYENPIEHACHMREGQVFIANGWHRPEDFCDSAWETLSPFVMTLAHGGEDFYSGWMKNRRSLQYCQVMNLILRTEKRFSLLNSCIINLQSSAAPWTYNSPCYLSS